MIKKNACGAIAVATLLSVSNAYASTIPNPAAGAQQSVLQANEQVAADKRIAMLEAEFRQKLSDLESEFRAKLASLEAKQNQQNEKLEMAKDKGKVEWGGSLAYEYASDRRDSEKANGNKIMLSLEPQIALNEKWTGHATLEFGMDANGAYNSTTGDDVPYNSNYIQMTEAYVEGNVNEKTTVYLGRFPVVSQNDGGMVMDDDVVGAQVVTGDDWKFIATAGRFNFDPGNHNGDEVYVLANPKYAGNTASYGSFEVVYAPEKYSIGGAYHHYGLSEIGDTIGLEDYNAKALDIVSLGGSTKLMDNLTFSAGLAKSIKGDGAANLKKAYSFELSYGEADPEKPGSFGASMAYRYLTRAAAPSPTYDSVLGTGTGNQKGWEMNLSYTLFPSTIASLTYFKGKEMTAEEDTNASKLFFKLDFQF